MNKIFATKITRRLLSIVTVIATTACGGGGDSLAGGVNGSGLTDGSGGGEVTGFGSVIFSDSTFETTADTQFTIDDVPVLESSLREGMIATFEISDSNANLTSGNAQRIDASTILKGAVTGVNPLEVLGQSIVVTGDTLLEDVPGNDVANLLTSDLVEIYGLASMDNIIQATRIERKTLSGLVDWKLSGTVTNLAPSTLNIGAQVVNINGVAIDNCVGGVGIGDFVEVKADPNPGFVNGNTLNMVTKVECVSNAIPIPSNPSGTVIRAEFEGVVSDFTGGADIDFMLGNQLVVFNNATEFRGGTLDDLVNGTRVEAEGSFNTSTGLLNADEIKFRQTRVRIEAGVNPIDITVGQSLEILGITVLATAATEDDDAILSAGLGGARQVEVRGFVDSNGDVIAEEVRDRGSVDNSDVRLRGPIDTISNPMFSILGVPVDSTGAAAYLDLQGSPLANIAAFFGLLSDGVIVEVEDAQLNAGPSLSMDGDSTVELED